MRIVDVEQGSDEWKKARTGKVTASMVDCVTAKKGGAEAATRKKYKIKLVGEILSGEPADFFHSAKMDRGTDIEPLAREAYAISRGVEVSQVGFVLHPTIERAGASPDGIVGEDGIMQIKCPDTHTHLQYILEDKVPADYQKQMLWEMACTERKWCDFVSFDFRLPEHLQLFVKRFERDDLRIAEIEREVIAFNLEVDDLLFRLAKQPQPEEAHV